VLLAHAWPLVRDRARLAGAAERMAELPLGAGAIAGSGIPIDRKMLQRALGFRRVSPNSLDVTGARDFVADMLFVLTMIATDVSRLAGELMTYASSEYGFVRLADAYCTGSSLLPQKRNPDVLELGRAKAAPIAADLMGMLALVRGLPAGYSKDLQEDKGFLFDAADHLLLTLPAIRGAVETLEPVEARMVAALDPALLATDLADGLVSRGVPFREAHRLVGELVLAAEAQSVPLTSVPRPAAAAIHADLPDLVSELGSWEDSVERRPTAGGSSRVSVARQLEELTAAFALGE
jgi:argininosuccinate lyase